MQQTAFSDKFIQRMKELEDYRKQHNVRDFTTYPYPFTDKELKEQEERHRQSKMKLEKRGQIDE